LSFGIALTLTGADTQNVSCFQSGALIFDKEKTQGKEKEERHGDYEDYSGDDGEGDSPEGGAVEDHPALQYPGGEEKRYKYVLSCLDASLKKRCDLIPNLVGTVKMYMYYEQNLLNQLTEMRVKAISGVLSLPERVDMDRRMESLMCNIV